MSARKTQAGGMALWPTLLFLILGSCGFGFAQSQPQVDLTGKNVLVLHAFEGNAPIFRDTDRGISKALQSGGISSLNHFFESLELRRNPGSEHRKLLVEQMRMRYGHRRPDIIITMYPEAMEFVMKDCGDIFPDVPILALYLPQGFELPKTNRPIIGHAPTVDILGTLEIALKLAPGAKRVYVVNGVHEVDRRLEDQARRVSKKWEGQMEFLYLSHLPFKDMLAAVSNAPPGSIILALAFSQDVTGNSYTTPVVVERLSRISAAPVFGILESMLGQGIAGGKLLSFELIGKKSGQLAMDILSGAKMPVDVPAALDAPTVPMFDWRQLRHWKLNENALPAGSIVLHREATFWDFRYYILGALAFFLLETALIVFLMVQKRRKNIAERSLKRVEEKYRNIFEGALEGIFESSPEGRLLTANDSLASMLGYDSADEATSALQDLATQAWVNPDERAQHIRLLEKQEVVLNYECQLRRKDGKVIWVSMNTRRVCSPDGRTLYLSGFLQNITEHRQNLKALAESQAQLLALFDSTNDMIWSVDPVTFGLVTFNRALKDYFFNQRGIEISAGMPPEQLLPADYAVQWREFYQRALRDGSYTTEYLVAAGTNYLLLSINPMKRNGKVFGISVLGKDITARRQVEIEARRLKDELAYISRLSTMGGLTSAVAHEINQPLTAILSNAQAAKRFLARGNPDMNEITEILEDIIRDDNRAAEVIRKIRSLLKKEEIRYEPLDLNDVAEEILKVVRNDAALTVVSIEKEFTTSLPSAWGDRIQLQQVILNLIFNAAEAMRDAAPDFRRMIVRTSRQEDRFAQVSVRDFGPGIPEDSLHRLFEPFYTTKSGGMGMGLAISKDIVQSHRGEIRVVNNPDRGVTVSFTVPFDSGVRP